MSNMRNTLPWKRTSWHPRCRSARRADREPEALAAPPLHRQPPPRRLPQEGDGRHVSVTAKSNATASCLFQRDTFVVTVKTILYNLGTFRAIA